MASNRGEGQRVTQARTFLASVDRVRGFFGAVNQQVSTLSEARFFDHVDNPYLIRAFDGGSNDCGLFVGDEMPTGTLADRLFELRRSRAAEDNILAMEFKLTTGVADTRGNIIWKFDFRQKQLDHCQAIILSTINAPHFVAFIPMHYVHQRKILTATSHFFETARPVWTLHTLPPFAPEFAPFIVPIACMGRAIDRMRDYALGVTTEWINEHTGAKYDVPKPTRVTSELLEPGFLPWRRALEAITQIHEAFTECPGDFKPELLDIFPLYGDFKFVQRSTGTEIIVEIKSRQCEWELNSGEPYMRHHQYAIGFEGRHIFSWKTQWDFLLTKHEDAQTQALFLPRDLIPVSWWNADPTSPDKKLAWPSDAVGVLKDYVVDLTSNSRLVADIESIFHLTETDRTSVKAVNSIPEAPYQFVRQPKAPGTQDEPGGTDDPPEIVPLNTDYWRPRKWTSSSYQRGFGSSLHEDCRGNTYEVWAKEALWELCRARGQGLMIDTGKRNLKGRIFFAKYTWSRLDRIRYDRNGETPRGLDTDKDAPVIPLSFIRLVWPEMLHPAGTSNSEFISQAIEHRLPSIIVCDAYPVECIRQPHARFILPSTELPSRLPKRHQVCCNDGIMDQFHTSDDEVIDALVSALEGNLRMTLGKTFQTRDYCCFLRTAMDGAIQGFPTKD